MSNDYFKAQGWFKNYATSSEDSRGVFQELVKEDEEAFRLASAETDKIKAMMNEQYGPGTVKYGSEIKQPEMKTPQAIFEFTQRNPAADGGRMEFGRGKKVLDKTEKKNVLNWGKNKSKALGETWSDKKTLKEYNNSSRFSRSKIRLGIITGEGIPGFKKKGDVKSLTKEQQKLWDATMADKVGKWENYDPVDRSNWLRTVDEKLDKFKQTKNLLSREELSNFLTEKLGKEFSGKKISGVRSGSEKSKFGKYVDDKLFATEFGDGQQKYYKKPTDAQIKFIKQNLLEGGMKNNLNKNTVNTIKKIDSLYGSIYRSGELPDLKIMMQKLNLTGNQIAYAEAQLARIYGGHKFNNGPDIRINKKTSSDMFDIIAKSGFGNPRKNQVYQISLELIDEGLGNEKGTFRNLKNKAVKILHDNKIDVYDPKKGKKAVGFNIDEFAGVTGSGKSQNIGVSQFINIMEGNLNTKTLASFQGGLSKARAAVEAAKGTPRYNSVLKEQMELINTRAANLEAEYGIKLARLERPADINNMSADEVKRLKNIKLGTDENLYQRLVKDAKASGYSIKVPEGSLTIQEFTDPNNKRARELIALVGCPNFKGKQAFAEGGRTGFSEGGDCFDKGQKLINSGMDGASKAGMRNFSNVANRLFKMGAAVTKYGIIPEAVLIAADTAIRMDLGDTFEEGLLRAADYLTPDSIFGDFKQKADLLKVDRTFSPEMKKIVAQSFGYNNQLKKIKSLKNEKKNLELMSGDGGAFDEIGNLETKYVDERIKKAENDLKTKYTKTGQESIDFYANSILDESYDKSMANSKYSKRRLKDQTDGFSSFGLDDYLDKESGTLFPRQKTQTELNKDLNVNRRILTGSPSEKKFMELSTMPTGPRQGSEMDNFVARANEYHKNIGSGIQVNSDLMRLMQEAKKEEKNMSIADMVKVYGAEAILGTQGNQGQPIKQKPMYDYAEGGIIGLRSKYEYKK